MNILECTINMKKETQAHYERLAEVVAHNELKRLFALFASAEGEHVRSLVALENSMRASHVQDLGALSKDVCVHSPQSDLLQLAKAMKDDPDACRHAEQEEEETIDFLDRLNSQAESGELKKICQLLADKERGHLKMLEEIYFFVEEPKTYLEWGEFSNLRSL